MSFVHSSSSSSSSSRRRRRDEVTDGLKNKVHSYLKNANMPLG
jgi:hypothetical protein